MNDKSPEKTEVKTMWSESLLDALYFALRKNKSDEQVKEVIGDLKNKGYDDQYIINKVQKKVGTAAVARIEALITGKVSKGAAANRQKKKLSKAEQARTNFANKRKDEGLFDKIKRLFGGG